MSSPKVVVIGAGSYFFGRPVIWNMATSEVLKEGTLAFVDTNPDVLATMMNLARFMGYKLDGSEEDFRELGRMLMMFALIPVDKGTP